MDSGDSRYNCFPVFLIILFGLITTGSCDADDSQDMDCTHLCSSCHNRNTRPLFCDEEGFKLVHRNDMHKLETGNGTTYTVWYIDDKAYTMLLTLDDHYDGNCSGLQGIVNTTLSTALFKYVHNVHNLTLQCNTNEAPVPNSFSCPTNVFYKNENKDVVQVFVNGTVPCPEGNVQVTVVLEPIHVEDWPSLEETLTRGFWVQYLVEEQDRFNWKVKVAIGLSTASGSIVIMMGLFYFYLCRRKKKEAAFLLSQNISSDPSSRVVDFEKSNHLGVHLFSYFELEEATNNFDSAKELGDGGFGTVYYGKLRDGRAVAVKRLYEHNFKRVEQFQNEIEILTRLRHKNLVSLYGCTSRHSRELLLVYEYISNGTVADHLHGDRAKPGSLPLCTRLKIAVETANALSYLHASDIIHRDVKTNNILLDEHFCVKVADFGLSRLFPTNVTHVSTAPQGTPGYVDPDYHQCYQLTDKSDVFSFGVVLIELISSMPAVDITRHRHEINLSNLAIGKIQGKAVHELVDPGLRYEADGRVRRAVEGVAELAFGCLQGEKDLRPSMVEVLEALRRIQSEMCDTEEVVLSPGSAGMGWSSSNDTTPNASV